MISTPLTWAKQRGWPACPGITPRWAGYHPHTHSITMFRTTHLHSRRENSGKPDSFRVFADSSPRGRGKLLDRRVGLALQRLIPARAGKTFLGLPGRLSVSVHPRAGGENFVSSRRRGRSSGSSPRGRGKPPATQADWCERRLIPARAGKTHPPRRRPALSPAHPRVDGENATQRHMRRAKSGSSPRRRGKRRRAANHEPPGRLIPALAGKTT